MTGMIVANLLANACESRTCHSSECVAVSKFITQAKRPPIVGKIGKQRKVCEDAFAEISIKYEFFSLAPLPSYCLLRLH